MTSRKAERRRHVRIPTAIVVADRSSGFYLIENLSEGGALLHGNARFELGDEVSLFLQLLDRPPIKVTGQVVRKFVDAHQQHLFGVEFTALTAEALALIRQMLLAAIDRMPHVLVVDDDEEVRDALARDLRILGHRSISVGSALDGMQQLAGERTVSAAIVDLHLDGEDGLAFLDNLSKQHPAIRRILMSGDIRAAQLTLATISGRAHAVIDKPWSRADLASVLTPVPAER